MIFILVRQHAKQNARTIRSYQPNCTMRAADARIGFAWLGGNALKAQLGKEPSDLALLVLLGEHLQHMRTHKGEKRALVSRLLWRSPCAWLGP